MVKPFSYQGNRFTYHSISAADIEWARELHNDPEVLSMLTDPTVISPEQQIRWYVSVSNSSKSERLVVRLGGERVGLVRIDNIDHHNKNVCLGLDIAKEFRGRGYASEVYKDMFRLFFEKEGMNRIWLLVAEYNHRARHIYQSLGFREEGIYREALLKEGQYYDYILMGILKSEYHVEGEQVE